MRYRTFGSGAVIFSSLILLIFGCVKEYSNQILPNIPPKTFLWLFPDSSIAEGPSKQRIRWWGEDRDGFIIGYLFAVTPDISIIPDPDNLSYIFTTISDTTIRFPLLQAEQKFFVVVRAIDNNFKGLPQDAHVHLMPKPYWDKNANDILDSNDAELMDLLGAIDPIAAKQQFPTINSPPMVSYLRDPIDPSKIIQPPETTFTVASFGWIGTDPDGDETIAGYRFNLNDSTSNARWFDIPSTATMVTLMVPRINSDNNSTGIANADVYIGTYPNMHQLGSVSGLKLNASNIFYVQAKDVANANSSSIRLPQAGKIWYVKKPMSRLLMISDYQKSDLSTLRAFYRNVFSTVANGMFANYDELDIRYGAVPPSPGILVPSFTQINPAFVLTLKLFDCILWHTDMYPSLSIAQEPLFYYTNMDFPTKIGRVIFTTEFQSAADPSGALKDFAPIDSISSVDLNPSTRTFPSLGDTRVPGGYVMQSDSSDPSNIYPVLSYVPAPPNCFIRPIYKRTDSRYIYHLQPDQPRNRPDGSVGIRYYGTPNLAVIDNAKRFVFIGVPLNYLDGNVNGGQGITAFLKKVLIDEFGLK